MFKEVAFPLFHIQTKYIKTSVAYHVISTISKDNSKTFYPMFPVFFKNPAVILLLQTKEKASVLNAEIERVSSLSQASCF